MVAAPRLHVREHRRARGDLVEVIDRERDAELPGDRKQVQDAVRRTARRDDRRGSVLDRVPRDDLRRPDVAAHEIHDDAPAFSGSVDLIRRERGDAVEPGRAEPDELEHRRHRVGGELTAAGTRAGARGGLQLVQIFLAELPGGMRADPLVDVRNRHVPPAEETWRDRARVEHDRRDVEAPERHHRAGIRLVAGDEANQAVEEVAARDCFDRVGDHLARDERRAHAGGAHRGSVRDGDCVELHRRPARLADAALHVLGELALVQVARHRLDPRRRDTDDRLREILVGEAGAFQHRPRARAIRALGQLGTVALGGIGRLVVGRRHQAPFSIG